eukprot:SAG11_NODE_33529_length_276_cov_31.096045_1_plen_92_part_11
MSDDNKVYSATDVSTVIGTWEYSGTPPHDNISFYTSEARIKHKAAADAHEKRKEKKKADEIKKRRTWFCDLIDAAEEEPKNLIQQKYGDVEK